LIKQYTKSNKILEARLPKEVVKPPPVVIIPIEPTPPVVVNKDPPFGLSIEYITFIIHKLWSAIFPS